MMLLLLPLYRLILLLLSLSLPLILMLLSLSLPLILLLLSLLDHRTTIKSLEHHRFRPSLEEGDIARAKNTPNPSQNVVQNVALKK